MKKISFLIIYLLVDSVWANDVGIHFVVNFNRDRGDTAAVGTADYYYQGGDMLASVDMSVGAVRHVTMLQKGAALYKLDPKEKTYMEIPQVMKDAAKNMSTSENKGSYKATGKKKKIAGYDCEIYIRKTNDSTDTACLNQQLYQQYQDLFSKMQEFTTQEDLVSSTKGFPLEIDSLGVGANKNKTTILITSIEKGNYSSKLSIPKDYQEKSLLTGGLEMLKKMTDHP